MAKFHKIAKKVKCNGLVKRWTLDQIRQFTYMSLGEVYDCCESGNGLLSQMDSDTLSIIKKLNGLLRKIDLPVSLNKDFSLYLKKQKESYRCKLKILTECISSGVMPIYYRDILLWSRLAHDSIEAHSVEKEAFKNSLRFIEGKDFSLFLEELEQKYHYGKTTKTYLNPKARYNRFLRQFYDYNNDDGRPIKQQMFDNAYNSISVFIGGYGFEDYAISRERTLIKNPRSREEMADEILYEKSLSRLLYDDRYCFTTKYDGDYGSEKLSNRFRKAVEYICTIPSKSNPLVVWQLLEDCRIIEDDIVRWKDYLKSNRSDKDLISDTKALINIFNDKMNRFVIPSITIDFARNEFEDDFDFPFFEMLDANTTIYGMTAVGLEVGFEFKIEQEELNIIKKESQRIRSYNNSKDKEHKILYKMFSKYKMDFLLRYIGLNDLDNRIQHGGLNALCMVWASDGVANIKSYNGRFFEYPKIRKQSQ